MKVVYSIFVDRVTDRFSWRFRRAIAQTLNDLLPNVMWQGVLHGNMDYQKVVLDHLEERVLYALALENMNDFEIQMNVQDKLDSEDIRREILMLRREDIIQLLRSLVGTNTLYVAMDKLGDETRDFLTRATPFRIQKALEDNPEFMKYQKDVNVVGELCSFYSARVADFGPDKFDKCWTEIVLTEVLSLKATQSKYITNMSLDGVSALIRSMKFETLLDVLFEMDYHRENLEIVDEREYLYKVLEKLEPLDVFDSLRPRPQRTFVASWSAFGVRKLLGDAS
eukprot:Trichotokara_eunicae@DN6653_c0_g1_i1.p1